MEYKSEIINFEKEDAESKKRMLGSDKVNIEDVKERLSNLDAGKVVKYDHEMNLATQYMVDYKNDVSYLLSIIEQQEKENRRLQDELQRFKYRPTKEQAERLGIIKPIVGKGD